MARVLALVATLVLAGFGQLLECKAQNKSVPAEYDYLSLALTSISNSVREASKLPDIPQRVKLLIQAVNLLPVSQHDESLRILDVALDDLKRWASEDNVSWYQRHTAATLRTEVLALYARVDPEKATALQKEFQAKAESTATSTSATSLKTDTSFTQFSNQRTIADQPAKMALSFLDADPDKALALVIQSLQEGIVSGFLVEIVQKLAQSGNRAFLNKLELSVGKVLAAKVTLDPSTLAYASALLQADKDMPTVTRGAFVSFFMGSLQLWSNLVRDAGAKGDLDSSYINGSFIMYSLNVRPALLQYAPGQLFLFDSVMDQLGSLISADTRLRMQAFQPETFSDPRDRLNDILRDPAAEKRDLRLVRLVSELLGKESEDPQKRFELAADAISGFSDPDAKSAYGDLLTIKRMDTLVKQKKFIEAQQLAGSISSEETRAWSLLALANLAAKSDLVFGFELISTALKALDKASPSPQKVELALLAAAMLAKNDPQRAFDTLLAASKYANSSAAKIDPPAKPPFAFGLEASLGEARTRLGVVPESLSALKIDPALSVLATTDWFRADQIADDIREPSLRLQLKLHLAGAVLAQKSKPKRKESSPRAFVKN